MKSLLALATLSLTSALALGADLALTDDQLAPAFTQADLNKNGTVELAEARRFGIDKKAFKVADPDNDNSLDKKEFAAALVTRFKSVDPDNDGTIDDKEASKAGLKDKAAFTAADPDKDGTIDLPEYVVALTLAAKKK